MKYEHEDWRRKDCVFWEAYTMHDREKKNSRSGKMYTHIWSKL